MNPLLAVVLALLLFLGNMLYSAYSVKVLKEHSKKLRLYKHLREENLKLRARIEEFLNIKELERYALKKGFKPFNWEEFVIYIVTEPSEKDRTRKKSK